MRRKKTNLLFLVCFLSFCTGGHTSTQVQPSLGPEVQRAAPQNQDKITKKVSTHQPSAQIAIKINHDVVTYQDIKDRVELILFSSHGDKSEKKRASLIPQVKSSLIQEILQKQVCKQFNIHVSNNEVIEAVKSIAQDNGMSLDAMKKMFKEKGVPIETLEKRLEAQIGWGRVVRSIFSHNVQVGEKEAKEALERLEENQNKTQYELLEIVMYVDSKEQAAAVQRDMRNIQEELHKGVPFRMLAQQFSQSTSATKGGYIGWFTEGQRSMPEEEAIKKLKPNQWTAPMRFNGGFRILYLKDMRRPGKASLGETKCTYWTVAIPISNLSETDQELIAGRIEELQASVTNCDQFEKKIKQWGYKIDKPEPTSFRDLPDILERLFKDQKIGRVLGPINVGHSLICAIICKMEAPTTIEKPTISDITRQLYTYKLEQVATREFNKAMSVAFIDDHSHKM